MTHLDSEAREPMLRVSPTNPCTVCAKPDWCGISADGRLAVCMRTENSSPTKNGGWLHQLTEPIPRTSTRKSRVVFGKNWTVEAEKFAANLDPERKRKFVASLSLPPDALDVLPLVGYFPDDTAGPCFTFPEVNAAGTIIGISRRWKKGGGPNGKDKMMIAGGHRGLTLPTGWRDRPGPVFVCEGPTDSAAMTAAGLSCVGRPGTNMGAELLAELFRELPSDRDIIIVGENDEKPDGKWPGKTGAIAVAGRLAELLHRPVRWSLTPHGEKDPRQWFAAQVAGAGESVDWTQFGRDFTAAITTSAVVIAPPESASNSGDSRDATAGKRSLVGGWGPPSPLPEMPTVPPFPLDLFPAKITDYWQASANSLHVPPDYVAIPALPLLGAAIGRSRAAAVKRTYAEPPLLWCVLIAPPGRAKSPSLKLAKGPLSSHTRKWREKYQQQASAFASEIAVYETAFAKWKKNPEGEPPRKPDKPVLTQLVLDKFTVESLVRINADNPRGVCLAQDELAGLVTGLGQYKGGKGDDKQTLLSLWAGAEAEVNRVSDKSKDAGGLPLYIPHTFVGVAGMIQPDLLTVLRGDFGRAEFVNDGWADRFLLSFPDPPALVGETWATVSADLEQGYAEVFQFLLGLQMKVEADATGTAHQRPYYLTFDRNAEDEWQKFTDRIAVQANALDRTDPYAGVLSKLKHYALRLTALVYCLRAACGEITDGYPVDGETVRRAAALVDYFEAHGRRCLGIGWADRSVRVATRLLAWLSRNPERKGFNRTEAFLALKDKRDVKTSEALAAAFRLLVDHGYLRPLDRPENTKPGPIPETYTVNPAWVRDCSGSAPRIPTDGHSDAA
ncbi:MAG: DUF3987 domain-containing protein [Planctomycetes bacterium]|nr:DUF3987 domain-containing protein [Planctomycetota bacterium]